MLLAITFTILGWSLSTVLALAAFTNVVVRTRIRYGFCRLDGSKLHFLARIQQLVRKIRISTY